MAFFRRNLGPSAPRSAAAGARPAAWAMGVGMVLLSLGLKGWLIASHGSDLPLLDQWAAEGVSVLHPWVRDTFGWSAVLWPHGEHHPALARVLSLGLFVWNGQWDCRAELAANALLFAGYLAALAGLAARLFTDWRRPAALLGVLVLLGLPGIYENHLWGFQTVFIGVLAFGLLQLLGMAEDRGWAWWCVGALAGIVVLYTLASGFMSAVVLCAVTAGRLAQAPRSPRHWLTLAVNLALAYWGWRLLAAAYATPGGRATDLGEFCTRLTVLLAWPTRIPSAALLLQLPLVLCLVQVVRERAADRERLLVGVVGLWCWALTACLAAGRNNGYGAVAGRYLDVLATGLLANVLAALLLWPRRRSHRVGWGLGATVWCALVGPTLWAMNSPDTMRWLREVTAGIETSNREMLTTYLRCGKFGPPGDSATHPNLPHPSFTRQMLDDPLFQRHLPPSVVPPLAVVPDPEVSRGFERRAAPDGRGAVLVARAEAAAPAVLISRPIIRCGRPLLQLGVRGVVGPGMAELYVEDLSGQRYELLDRQVHSPDRLKTERIRCDATTIRVVARVAPGQTLEFTEPVELGWLSFVVPKLLRCWWLLVASGGALFLAGTAGWLGRLARSGAPQRNALPA